MRELQRKRSDLVMLRGQLQRQKASKGVLSRLTRKIVEVDAKIYNKVNYGR
jgi:hypothetical protein